MDAVLPRHMDDLDGVLSGHLDGILPRHLDGVLPGHLDLGVFPGTYGWGFSRAHMGFPQAHGFCSGALGWGFAWASVWGFARASCIWMGKTYQAN